MFIIICWMKIYSSFPFLRVELQALLMLATRRLAGHLGWFIIIKKHCMVGWLNSQSTVSDLSIPRFGDLSGPTVAYSPPSHYSLGAPPTLKDPMETVTVEVGSILSNSKEKLKSLNEPLSSAVSHPKIIWNYLRKLRFSRVSSRALPRAFFSLDPSSRGRWSSSGC